MKKSDGYVLVTGAGSGLGAACAAHFAGLGREVLALDLKFDASCSNDTLQVDADVCDANAITGAIEAATAKFGELRAAVHCAGILGAAKLVGRSGAHDLALFERVIRINLVGTFNVCRLAALTMSKNEPNAAGERGVLVTTSSVAAEDGQMGQCAYAASKGGVSSMMLPMARDLASLGIRAVAIAPGVFETPMMQAAPENVRSSLLAIAQFPKRFGQGREFAQLVESVIVNPMLNGTTIRLDGAIRMPAT